MSSDITYFHVINEFSSHIDKSAYIENREMYKDTAKELVEISINPEEHENDDPSLLVMHDNLHDIDRFFFNIAMDLTRKAGKWKRHHTKYEFSLLKNHICRFYKCEAYDDDEDRPIYFWKYVCLSKANMGRISDEEEIISSGYGQDHLGILQNLHHRISKLESQLASAGRNVSSKAS